MSTKYVVTERGHMKEIGGQRRRVGGEPFVLTDSAAQYELSRRTVELYQPEPKAEDKPADAKAPAKKPAAAKAD